MTLAKKIVLLLIFLLFSCSSPQKDIDKILTANEINFISLKFEGHSHEEKYWALRFENALSFLINE